MEPQMLEATPPARMHYRLLDSQSQGQPCKVSSLSRTSFRARHSQCPRVSHCVRYVCVSRYRSRSKLLHIARNCIILSGGCHRGRSRGLLKDGQRGQPWHGNRRHCTVPPGQGTKSFMVPESPNWVEAYCRQSSHQPCDDWPMTCSYLEGGLIVNALRVLRVFKTV